MTDETLDRVRKLRHDVANPLAALLAEVQLLLLSPDRMDAETLSTKECAAPIGGDIAGGCGLNGSATAKVVVKNGRAQGVTVTTDPPQPGVNSCMSARISGLSWRAVPGVTGCIRTFKVH